MKNKIFTALLLVFAPLMSSAEICKSTKTISLGDSEALLGNKVVTFIAKDLDTNICWVINPSKINTRHTPWSTFKIPHTLIALETGAVNAIDTKIVWDSKKHPPKDFWSTTWQKDQTLASAFKHSAAWYYQELVPVVGHINYTKWLKEFNYGNQTTQGTSDFWLNHELKISPAEQIEFLNCIITSHCGMRKSSLQIFEQIALLEKTSEFSLYAKTGAGPTADEGDGQAFEGWLVGYVRDTNGKASGVFALFVEAENYAAIAKFRKDFSLKLLTDLGMWNPNK